MDNDTIAFYGPLSGLILGMVVLLVGIFQSGLNPVTYAGIGIGLLSMVWLSASVAAG